MPRARKLTAAGVASLAHDGTTRGVQRHFDGDGSGLALQLEPTGSKSWVQSLVIQGKRRTFGLGGYPLVTLKRAREVAAENQRLAREGGDPLAARRAKRSIPTFQELAERVIETQSIETAPRSTAQWKSSLSAYAYPIIGALRVDAITVDDVMRILVPIWGTKRETAGRVRQRMATVLDWAIAAGHRVDNPARVALTLLPKKRAAVAHHRALPWQDVPAAVQTVRESGAWIGTKLAFLFLVLTACRSGEVRGAVWDEIDLGRRVWKIPAERMKARSEHRVPLSEASLAVLADAREITSAPLTAAHQGCELVFPSLTGLALSDSTISKLLRENGVQGVPHGFRSSFRDWAAETTDAPYAVLEHSLAHSVGSAVERAYARSDLFGRRRELMERWGRFVAGDAA